MAIYEKNTPSLWGTGISWVWEVGVALSGDRKTVRSFSISQWRRVKATGVEGGQVHVYLPVDPGEATAAEVWTLNLDISSAPEMGASRLESDITRHNAEQSPVPVRTQGPAC